MFDFLFYEFVEVDRCIVQSAHVLAVRQDGKSWSNLVHVFVCVCFLVVCACCEKTVSHVVPTECAYFLRSCQVLLRHVTPKIIRMFWSTV